jgi:hypothetical protein
VATPVSATSYRILSYAKSAPVESGKFYSLH